MNTHKGFAAVTVLIAIAAVALIGGGAYVATHPEVMQSDKAAETETENQAESKAEIMSGADIKWEFSDAGEKDGIPQTRVMLNGHHVGDFQGSCSEVGAEGGVDSKGLLVGELAAAQCWYAGGGDEIGVFGSEDGGVDVMVGQLGEPTAEEDGFRGNFELRTDIDLD